MRMDEITSRALAGPKGALKRVLKGLRGARRRIMWDPRGRRTGHMRQSPGQMPDPLHAPREGGGIPRAMPPRETDRPE